MRTIIISPILISLVLISCNSKDEIASENSKDSSTTDSLITNVDTAVIDEYNEITFSVMPDGPDEELYITNEDEYSDEEVLSATSIDIIPYIYGADSGDDLYPEMRCIARDHFRFYYGIMNEYSGTINLYYDQYKKNLACSWKVVNGKPDGNCTLYDLENEIYIERIYQKGKWIYSGIEPYAVNWTYDQSSASLIIADTLNAFDGKTINLMHSINDTDWVYFGEIIDKASFANNFKINGDLYTGKLMAYQHPGYDTHVPEFELNFVDGLLDGDIKIYAWWGELELHEIFDHGVLVEQVYKMDESMMDGVAKPIIYIYPHEETEVSVNLNFDGRLTHTYPKYLHGWKVTASPDGTLIDEDGKEYYALYWEGHEKTPLTIPNGTIVKGSETIAFLEDELPKMGLNPKETNEFIIYWMPLLENNPYNLIHFSSNNYTDMAKLNITPTPETLIRVMMVFQKLDTPVDIEPQNLTELYKKRKGFTVVEWGGRQLNPAIN